MQKMNKKRVGGHFSNLLDERSVALACESIIKAR